MYTNFVVFGLLLLTTFTVVESVTIDEVNNKIEELKTTITEGTTKASQEIQEQTIQITPTITDYHKQIVEKVGDESKVLTQMYNNFEEQSTECQNFATEITNENNNAIATVAEKVNNFLTAYESSISSTNSRLDEIKKLPESLTNDLSACQEEAECLENLFIRVTEAIENIKTETEAISNDTSSFGDLLTVVFALHEDLEQSKKNFYQIYVNIKNCYEQALGSAEFSKILLQQFKTHFTTKTVKAQNELELFQEGVFIEIKESTMFLITFEETYSNFLKEITFIKSEKRSKGLTSAECDNLESEFTSKYSNEAEFTNKVIETLEEAIKEEGQSLTELENEINTVISSVEACEDSQDCIDSIQAQISEVEINLSTAFEVYLENVKQSMHVVKIETLLKTTLEEMETNSKQSLNCYNSLIPKDPDTNDDPLNNLQIIVTALLQSSTESVQNLYEEFILKTTTTQETQQENLEAHLLKENTFLSTYEKLSTPELLNSCSALKSLLPELKSNFLSLFNELTAQNTKVIDGTVIGIKEQLELFSETVKNLQTEFDNCDNSEPTCQENVLKKVEVASNEIPLNIQSVLSEARVKLDRNQNKLNADSEHSLSQFINSLRGESKNYIKCLIEVNGISIHDQMEEDITKIIASINTAKIELYRTYIEEGNNFQINLLMSNQSHLKNAYDLFEKELELKLELAISYELDLDEKCELKKREDLRADLIKYSRDLENGIEEATNTLTQTFTDELKNLEDLLSETSFLYEALNDDNNYCDWVIDIECVESAKIDNDNEINKIDGATKELLISFKATVDNVQVSLLVPAKTLIDEAIQVGTERTKEMADCVVKAIQENSGFSFKPCVLNLLTGIIVVIFVKIY